jgi:hypothetical protein
MESSPMSPEVKRVHIERLVKELGVSFTDATTLLDNNGYHYGRAKAEGLAAKQQATKTKKAETDTPKE